MARGPNLSRAERAIHYACCSLGGMELAEVNEILAEVGFRPVESYRELMGAYRRYLLGDLKRLAPAIRHPPTRALIARVLRGDKS